MLNEMSSTSSSVGQVLHVMHVCGKISPMYDRLRSPEHRLIPTSGHIVGDSAYPYDTLVCPYRDNGHLTKRQKEFNVVLSSTRVVIEQAFGSVKGRLRGVRPVVRGFTCPRVHLSEVPVVRVRVRPGPLSIPLGK